MSTTNGSWSACEFAVNHYYYEWLSDGSVVASGFSSYHVGAADIGHSIQSAVMACNDYGCSPYYYESSNWLTVTDQTPYTTTGVSPAGDSVTGKTPTLSGTFDDPDPGQSGYVAYSVYRDSDNSLAASGSGPSVVSGTSAWTTPALAADQWYYFYAWAVDASGVNSAMVGPTYFYVNVPPAVSSSTPVSGATLPTTTPVLSASASDGESISYEFQVASDSGFANIVADSSWVPGGASIWTVPPGYLQNGDTYYWRARAVDVYGAVSAWTGGSSFTVQLANLGSRSYWPIWSHGPLAVNEANGNLIVSTPGPSYPTAAGALDASLTYNSQSTASSPFGTGWTLSVGADGGSPPVELIDHNASGASPQLDALERVSADGSSDYYTPTAGPGSGPMSYVSAIGDGSQLTKNGDGSWTLIDPDGSIYNFNPAGTSGVATLASVQRADAATPGQTVTTLYYTYSSSQPTEIKTITDGPSGDPGTRTLAFAWNNASDTGTCSDAIVCVTGPDGVTWKYIGNATNGTSGSLVKVNDGTRDVLGLGYGANGLIDTVQNANDLDPTHASPNYNASHSLTIAYDTNSPARVASVSDGPTTNQTPATSTWSFSYHANTHVQVVPRASHYDYLVQNNSPVAYYPLDETSGTSANDASGNGHTGTYTGGYTLGVPGASPATNTSVSLDGSSGQISVPDSPALRLGGEGTIEFWVNLRSAATEQFLVGKADNADAISYGVMTSNSSGGSEPGLMLWIDADGTWGPTTYAATQDDISLNAWHYVVGEWDSSGLRLYVDGSLAATAPTAAAIANATSLRIGGATGFSSADATMDEVAIYDYALSPDQIAADDAAGAQSRTSDGYTTLTPPDQQGSQSPKSDTVYYDSLGQPLESVDTLGDVSEVGFNDRNELLWSEDAEGNPTDHLYVGPTENPSVATPVVETIGPDPDGSGPLQRPVTTYRYDETQVGTAQTAGSPLDGLQAVYFTKPDLSGGVQAIENDPNVDYTWSSNPQALSGDNLSNGFSVRWSGELVVTTAGSYTFSTPNSSGTRLILDGSQLIDNWTTSDQTSQPITLAAGLHDIVLEYFSSSASGQVHLHWSCSACSPGISDAAIPAASLRPGWLNQTSTISPAGRLVFSHYTIPASGDPEYTLVQAGAFPAVTAHGGDGGGGANGCTAGAGGAGGGVSSGSGISLSYSGGSGGSGDVYCNNGAPDGGAGGSSAGSSANGANGQAGCYYNSCTAYGGSAPSGGGNGGDAGWAVNGDGPTGLPGSTPGGGGGAAGATQCCDAYAAGPGADGRVTITPNVGIATTYTTHGTYTYTVPAGVTFLSVQLWGAGGGAGQGYSTGSYGDAGGGGGGGGAYVQTATIAVTNGESLRVTVGAGGAAGPAVSPGSGQPAGSGTNGGDTTVQDVTLITSYSYDRYGRPTQQVMPKGNANRTIDSSGDLQGLADTTYATSYAYYGDNESAAPPSAPDCSGSAVNQGQLLKSMTVHGEATTSYVYDSAGDMIAKTNGAGTTCWNYNNEGLLTSRQAPGESAATSFTYDPAGQQLTASGPTGTVTSYYDEQGRLVESTDSLGAEEHLGYDADGNVLSRIANSRTLSGTTCPSSSDYCTSYSYNSADQLTGETDPAGKSYSFFYDDRGNLRGTQYPNGTFSWVDTNPDGWISDEYNRHGTITASTTPATVPSDSGPLADFTYSYDLDGKRLSQTEIFGSTKQTTSYIYDQVGRLSQVTLPSGTCRDYSYDLDSNRTEIQESPTGCSGTFSTTASYTYNPATTPGLDELTSIDQGGNTTNYSYATDGDGQVSGYGTTSLSWDGWGRLKAATVGSNTITYTYDPTGALKSRSSSSPAATINYLLGDLFETGASGTITTSYADGPAGNLASYAGPPTSSATVSFLYYDDHGNLAAEANASGTLTASHSYDPFGAPTDTVPANTTTHRFVGRWDKQYDTTTGLILMGARPYDPTTGRFLSVDPVPGGSLNNYDYAGQDPINNYDLDGAREDAEPESGADLCNTGQNACLQNTNWGHVASFGTILHRLSGATTVGATAIDLTALACTVATGGACGGWLAASLIANITDAAASNHIFSRQRKNLKGFGIGLGFALAGGLGGKGLDSFAEYLDESEAGGGSVVSGIYGGLMIVLDRLSR